MSYQWTDQQPADENYYRIKQVDYNGDFNYSETRFIALASSIAIQPNPTQGGLSVNAKEVVHKVELTDPSGRMLMQKSINSKQFELDLNGLNPSVYLLHIYLDNRVIQRRIILQ